MSLIFLVLVVVASLFSIGFSRGALDYMREKMDNPFIKFISVNIPYGHDDANNYRETLADPKVKEKYAIESIEMVPTWYSNFKAASGDNITAYVRMMDVKSALYDFVKDNSELVTMHRNGLDLETSPWSCIVTSNFLERLNGKADADGFVTFVALFGEEGEEVEFNIPIATVVKQLPDNHDVAVSKELFFALRGEYLDQNPFDIADPGHAKYLSLFFPTGTQKGDFSKELKEHGLLNYRFVKSPTYASGFLITKSVDGSTETEEEWKKAKTLNENVARYYDPYAVYSSSSKDPELDPDKLIVNLQALDNVEAFKDYMLGTHKFKIDLNTVEAKENFNLFSKFVSILSVVLLVFSIVLIVYVMSTLLQGHIERNKKNLGTLKAFGMSNDVISIIYGGISLLVISMVFILGFAIASIVGNSVSHLLFTAFELKIEAGVDVFNLQFTLVLFGAFVLLPLLVLYLHVGRLLRGKTPGDLIYAR